MAVAEVGGVVEQGFVVCTNIKIDGNGARWIDACGSGVNRQFADGNIRTIHAPVADAEYFFRVRHHNQIHIVRTQPQRFKGFANGFGVVDIQIHRARTAVVTAPFLNCFAYGRVVHNRQHLRQMVGQQFVIQHFVAVVQLVEKNIFFHIFGI